MEITENSTDQLNQKQEKKKNEMKQDRKTNLYRLLTVGNKIRGAGGEVGRRVR